MQPVQAWAAVRLQALGQQDEAEAQQEDRVHDRRATHLRLRQAVLQRPCLQRLRQRRAPTADEEEQLQLVARAEEALEQEVRAQRPAELWSAPEAPVVVVVREQRDGPTAVEELLWPPAEQAPATAEHVGLAEEARDAESQQLRSGHRWKAGWTRSSWRWRGWRRG